MPNTHTVDLRYERRELMALFATARREDVEHGGRYTHGGGAINVWSHHCIEAIECDEGFDLDDLLLELGILERKALGSLKHGREAGGERS